MQTIQLQVNDKYMQNVLTVLNSLKDGIIEKLEIVRDKNLEYDHYFYERKEHISQTIKDMESGNIKMYSHEEFEKELDEFEKELTLKYAN